MSIFFLSIYIALIFIRPMDWWAPVMDVELVTGAAILTVITALPRLMVQVPKYWRAIPEVRAIFFLLIGVTVSFAYPTYVTGIRSAFSDFSKIVILYILIIVLSQKKSSFRILIWTVLLCTAWMATHGVLMGTRGYGFGPALPRWRPSQKIEGAGVYQIIAYGIFEDPNDLCLVFIIAMPILYAEFKATGNPLVRMIILLMIPLNACGAYYTNSRGGLVGVFGMLAAYVIGRLKGFKRWAMIVCAVGLVTVGAPARGGELGMVDKDRLVFWGDGLESFKQYPIFGVGYQNFSVVTGSGNAHAAHNAYVNALTELGIVGYIPFMLLLFLTAVHLRRASTLKNRISRNDQAYLVGLFSATIGYMTAIYFLSRTYNHVLYIILALSTGKVIQCCHDEETFQLIFGPKKTDTRRGLYFAFATIPFIWCTIKLGRKLGGG